MYTGNKATIVPDYISLNGKKQGLYEIKRYVDTDQQSRDNNATPSFPVTEHLS